MSALPIADVEPIEDISAAVPEPPPVPPPAAAPVKSKSELPPEEGAPTWMVTFGDMMALLLTFFILLFSMSEIEVEKFRDAAKSLHEGFGSSTVDFAVTEPSPVTAATSDSTVPSITDDLVTDQLDQIASALSAFAEENGLENSLLVDRADEGVYLRMNDAALFKPGLADVEAERLWVIEQLSLITMEIDIPVTVAGHSDNIPISSALYKSNWELSAARAAGVARALVDLGHNAEDIQVTAFGEYRPIESNDTPEGRARNRRVELFYSRQSVTEAQLAAQDESASAEVEPSDSPASP